MVRCERLIERDRWTLRVQRAELAADETTLVCDFWWRTREPVRTDRLGRPWPELVAIPVVDDRGTETAAWFTPQDSRPRRGERELRDPVAIDTAWISIDGERCELVEDTVPASATVGPVAGLTPALRHLWHQVAIHSHHRGPPIDLQPAIDALRAAGAVSDADVTEVVAVHATLIAIRKGQDPILSGDRLSEPWRSMFARRGRDDGYDGKMFPSTVLPPIDGISVAIRTIESRCTEFVVAVECKPSLGLMTMYDWDQGERLTWWAVDDRGNRYLGQTREWVSHDHEGRDDDSHGTITFWPALDPTARRLEIIPTAQTTQGALSIPLPTSLGAR